MGERRSEFECFSHLGDCLLCQRHIIPLQEQLHYFSSRNNRCQNWLNVSEETTYSKSHTMHNLLWVAL